MTREEAENLIEKTVTAIEGLLDYDPIDALNVVIDCLGAEIESCDPEVCPRVQFLYDVAQEMETQATGRA